MNSASRNAWHKPVLFGLCALLGGLIAAVPGEAWDRAAAPPPATQPEPPVPKIDIVFVLDVTGSMQSAIDGARDGIVAFVDELNKQKLDARVALITFRDRFPKEAPKPGDGEDPVTHDLGDGPFTSDPAKFREKAREQKAKGGADWPESSLDALVQASRLRFREDASRVLMLITDAEPKVPDKDTTSVEAAGRILRDNKINQLHLVTPEFGLLPDGNVYVDDDGKKKPVKAIFEPLQKETPGEWYPLAYSKEAVAAGKGFDKILPKVGEAIAQRTVKGVQSTVEVAEKDAWRLGLAIAGWTAIVGLGVALAIQFGQTLYLRRSLLSLGMLAAPVAGLFAGLISGAAGQALFQYTSEAGGNEAVARVGSWALLGLLLGLGTSLGVPNLGWLRGALGGLLGGLVGVGLFLWLSTAAGELPARLGGAAGLGLCVGLMIGVAEVAFRRAWLEVSYGPRETRTVTLGTEAVSVGGRPGCTVIAHGATTELRYRLSGGKVTCEDVTGGRQPIEVRPGDRRQVGKVFIVVGAAATAAPSTSSAPADRATYAPRAQPAAGHTMNAPTVLSGMPTGYMLRFDNGRVLVLVEGQSLTTADLPGLLPIRGSVTADLSRNPNDRSVIGLRNLTQRAWRVRMPDGTSRDVEPERSVKLAAGTQINFGSYSAEIRQ